MLLWLSILGALAILLFVGPVPGLVLAAGSVAAIVGWQMQSNARRRSALELRKCLSCSYLLTGLASAVDPGQCHGIDFGPRTCPECGRPWPMVPGPDGSGTL